MQNFNDIMVYVDCVLCPCSEIIITSGGENMAPVPIEDRIKEEVPFLSNVMVIGDKRKYITCFVTLKVSP